MAPPAAPLPRSRCKAVLRGHKRPIRAVAASAERCGLGHCGRRWRHLSLGPGDARTAPDLPTCGRVAPVDLAISRRWPLAGCCHQSAVAFASGTWSTTRPIAPFARAMAGYEFGVAFSPDSTDARLVEWNRVGCCRGEQRPASRFIPGDLPNSIAIASERLHGCWRGKRQASLSCGICDLQATPPVQLGRHRTYIHCVAFSPDGQTLLTGSEDGVVKLWDVPNRRAETFAAAAYRGGGGSGLFARLASKSSR